MSIESIDLYYSQRISQFDEERKIFDKYLNLVSPTNADFHQFDWENRQQEDYACTLTDNIKATELEYQQIKHELDETLRDLEEAKENNGIRQRQIQRLSELSQPIERDITYVVRDLNPSTQSKSLLSLSSSSPSSSSPSSSLSKLVKDGEIYEFERNLDEVTKRMASLTSSFMITLVQADDFSRSVIKESQVEIEKEKEKALEMSKALDKLDYECYLSASELLRLRLNILTSQREEFEEINRLEAEKKAYNEKEKQLKSQLSAEIETIKQKVQSELFQIKNNFDNQFESLDKKMKDLTKREKRAIKLLSGEKVQSLHHMIEESKEKYEKLRRRNSLELEGYQSEINILKQRFKQVKTRQLQQQARSQSRGNGSTRGAISGTRSRRLRSAKEIVSDMS